MAESYDDISGVDFLEELYAAFVFDSEFIILFVSTCDALNRLIKHHVLDFLGSTFFAIKGVCFYNEVLQKLIHLILILYDEVYFTIIDVDAYALPTVEWQIG